jgi:hypothetical protein
VQTGGAVLGVALELVLDVRRRRILSIAAEDLQRAAAALATKLRVIVNQGIGNHLYLPERLVTAGGLYTPTLYFTLIKLFAFDCHDLPRYLAWYGAHGFDSMRYKKQDQNRSEDRTEVAGI